MIFKRKFKWEDLFFGVAIFLILSFLLYITVATQNFSSPILLSAFGGIIYGFLGIKIRSWFLIFKESLIKNRFLFIEIFSFLIEFFLHPLFLFLLIAMFSRSIGFSFGIGSWLGLIIKITLIDKVKNKKSNHE